MNTYIKSKSWTTIFAAAVAVIAVVIAAAWFSMPVTDAREADVVVYKTPYCGCCIKWVEHLRNNGFDVSVVNVPSMEPTHKQLGVPRRLGSCHTATVGDYWVEGHVPADLIEQLLAEQPDEIAGIAAPGMPMGSPGMEGPNPVEYQVLAYGDDGKVTVYATRQGRTSAE
jgi:hypothetical protein